MLKSLTQAWAQASVSTAPLTQISASQGISSSGNATLEFYLADPSSDNSSAGQGLAQGADVLAQQWDAGSFNYQELRAAAGQAFNARHASKPTDSNPKTPIVCRLRAPF